jgi:hypothetical protein
MIARSTRRQLFGASAAILLIGSAGAGEAKAAELDGELIAACARFTWLEGEYGRLCRLTDWPAEHAHTPADEALATEFEAVRDEQFELGEWLAETEPRTPEGMQAKAGAVLAYLGDEQPDGMIGRLRLSVLRDMAGRAGV